MTRAFHHRRPPILDANLYFKLLTQITIKIDIYQEILKEYNIRQKNVMKLLLKKLVHLFMYRMMPTLI